MNHEKTSAAFFEQKYRDQVDPWNFEGSAYEQDRYAATLRALKAPRYLRAFEPGCSIGVLTSSLARYCDRLEAVDISSTAVLRAQQRCKDLPNVNIACGALPEALPPGRFDLIVFSEIGYYFEKDQLQTTIQRLVQQLDSGGLFIAVHWLGTSSEHILSGDEVHEIIRNNNELYLDEEQRYEHFRLDRMVRK